MRAVSRKAKVVIMDEPTSSLSEREIEALFSVVERLKKQDVAVIYISHKLNEIIEIGDDISIFKDGELVCTDLVANLTEAQMVKLMVGRDIGEYHIRARCWRLRACAATAFPTSPLRCTRGKCLAFPA